MMRRYMMRLRRRNGSEKKDAQILCQPRYMVVESSACQRLMRRWHNGYSGVTQARPMALAMTLPALKRAGPCMTRTHPAR